MSYFFLFLGLLFTLVEIYFLNITNPHISTEDDKKYQLLLIKLPFRLATALCVVIAIFIHFYR